RGAAPCRARLPARATVLLRRLRALPRSAVPVALRLRLLAPIRLAAAVASRFVAMAVMFASIAVLFVPLARRSVDIVTTLRVAARHRSRRRGDRDTLPDQSFDRFEQRALVAAHERCRDPFATGAARSADPVHVEFRHLGQLEVHDVWKLIDVEPS